MPWCPECRVEYVEGIKTCSDCRCELMDKLPSEKQPKIDAGEFIPVVAAEDEREAERLESLLDSEGIPSIRANAGDFEGWGEGMPLLVPKNFVKRALTVLQEDDMPALSGIEADDEANYDDSEEIKEYIHQGKNMGAMAAVALIIVLAAAIWFIYRALMPA